MIDIRRVFLYTDLMITLARQIQLKVKKFDDTEAVVLGHDAGEGRCAKMLGALRVVDKLGHEFRIGSGFTDA